jgi:hypothetical protein
MLVERGATAARLTGDGHRLVIDEARESYDRLALALPLQDSAATFR